MPGAILPGRTRLGLAALGVAVVVAALGVWAQNSALVGVNYDDAVYALLAKAVAAGEGYRLAFLPQALPGIKYPPVYPLSLVPFWMLAGSRGAALEAMKVWNGILIGVAAGLFTLLLSGLRILPAYLAVGAALLGFAAGSMMLVTAGLLSEPTYLVILFAALWAGDKVAPNARWQGFVAVGALAALTALTRAVGIAAVAAVVLGLWRRSGWRAAALAAAAACALILPWVAFTAVNAGTVPEVLVPRYGSYLQLYLANLAGSPTVALGIFWANFGAILQTLGGKMAPQLGPVAQAVTGGLLISLAALGSRLIGRRAPATASYPWMYLAIVAIWSFPPFRFVFVLFPILLALAAVSWLEIAKRLAACVSLPGSRKGLRLAWLVVGGLAVVNLAYRESRALEARVWDGAELARSQAASDLVEWVNANAPADAVIAFEFDPLIALYTGRQAVPNNYEPVHVWYRSGHASLTPLAKLFVDAGVDFVAVRRDVPQAASTIDSLLEVYPGSLELRVVTAHGVLVFAADLGALRSEGPSDAALGGGG